VSAISCPRRVTGEALHFSVGGQADLSYRLVNETEGTSGNVTVSDGVSPSPKGGGGAGSVPL